VTLVAAPDSAISGVRVVSPLESELLGLYNGLMARAPTAACRLH
jgi:hypothetical protein